MQCSSFYYRSRAKEYVALKMRFKKLAMVRVRFGYPRLTVLLKREGWVWASSWFIGFLRFLRFCGRGLSEMQRKQPYANQ